MECGFVMYKHEILPISALISYKEHPFKEYEGERLADMTESIKANGIITPIIVRPIQGEENKYEILSGVSMSILRSFLKKSILIALSAMTIMFCFVFLNISLNVYAVENNTSEIVILIDASGSMNSADPPIGSERTRITTEAIKSFAFLRPSFADTYISLVVYNASALTALDRTNVRTEWGINEYLSAVRMINMNQVSGINLWEHTTDIGGALQEDYQILSDSIAEKKAVLLFTDGRIDLGRGRDIAPSVNASNDARDALALAEIPVYTIGLNYDGTVDRAYLEDLSELTGGMTRVTEPRERAADTLIEYFLEIYANLFETIVPEFEPEEIPPSGTLIHTFNVYGQAVKEVNMMFLSESPINVSKVITHTGVDIRSDPNRCLVDSSDIVANVKLIEPMDRDWTIELIGNPGDIVKVSEISLFDISLNTTIPGNRISLNYGELLNFESFLHNNDRDIQILTNQIYIDSEATTYMEISDSRGVSSVYPGTINDARTGFNFNFMFDRPGDYTIRCTLSNERLMAVSEEIIVTINEPIIVLERDGTNLSPREGGLIFIGLANSISESNNANSIDAPPYLMGTRGALKVFFEDDLVDTIDFYLNEITADNKVEFKYMPKVIGNYTFVATFQGAIDIIESNAVSINFINSAINSDFPNNISYTMRGGNNLLIYDLSEYFRNDDNDILNFEVSITGTDNAANIMTAHIDGNILTISLINTGEVTFYVVAYDDYGGEYTQAISVTIKSFIVMVLVIVAIVFGCILLAIVALRIIWSRKRIGKRFKLSLSITENDEEKYRAEDTIHPLKKRSGYDKAYVNVWKILDNKELFCATVPDEFKQFCSFMTLTGQVVSKDKGFKIICKIKKQESKIFNGKNAVLFEFKDPDNSVSKRYTVTFSRDIL